MSLDCNDYDSPELGEEDPATDWAIANPQGYMAARALVAAINNGSMPETTQAEIDSALQVVDQVDDDSFFNSHPDLRTPEQVRQHEEEMARWRAERAADRAVWSL